MADFVEGSNIPKEMMQSHAKSEQSNQAVVAADKLWQKMEAFIEGDAKNFTVEAINELTAKTKDNRSITWLRIWAISLSSLTTIIVLLFLYSALIAHYQEVIILITASHADTASHITTLLLSFITGSFLFAFGLLAMILKAVSKPADNEIQTPGMEALKSFVEVVQKIMEK